MSATRFEAQFAATEIAPSHPISFAYRLALAAVVIGLLLLPLIYVGLVVAIGYGIYFHLSLGPGGMPDTGAFGLFLYVGPPLIGLVLIWFMLRPLFVRRPPALTRRELTADSEPAFFGFVEGICALIDAPRPRQIFVDWLPNASASLKVGWRGFFRREVDLTIGLPLAARLTIAQFGGVLAHEFGHFSQGTGMRLNFLIRTLTNWFGRIAFQPAGLPQKVAHNIRRVGVYGALLSLGAGGAIWVTRRILHGLLLSGHTISCYSLRQMEYDADLYQAKVSGPETVREVSRALRHLTDGFQRSMMMLERGANRGRCADNFIALLEARADVAAQYECWLPIPPSIDRTHWYDTHPSSKERTDHAARFQGTPALIDSRPARFLFTDFEGLSRVITDDYYQAIGLPVDKLSRLELDGFCESEALSPTQAALVNRFFANRAAYSRPVSITLDQLLDETQYSRSSADFADQWNDTLRETEPAFVEFLRARRERFTLLRAQTLLKAQIRFPPRTFSLRRRSSREVAQQLELADLALAKAEAALSRFDEVTMQRLVHALRASLEDSDARAGILETTKAMLGFQSSWQVVPAMEGKMLCLGELLNVRRAHVPRTRASAQLLELAQDLSNDLKQLISHLAKTEDPLSPGQMVTATMASRVQQTQLPFEQQILYEASTYLTYLQNLYFQLLTRLCAWGEAVENKASWVTSQVKQ